MEERPLSGKTVLFVIAPEHFRDEEYHHPREILEAEGAKTLVASTRTGVCRGMLGGMVSPDMALADAKSGDYDAVVVVGGSGSPHYLWDEPRLLTLLRDQDAAGGVVAGICLSSAVLARAGILKGKDATVFETPDSVRALKEGGANLLHRPLVVSGKIVTANGPGAARDFGRAIAERLKGSSPPPPATPLPPPPADPGAEA